MTVSSLDFHTRWPLSQHNTLANSVIRQQQDHFKVNEIPVVEPSGEGEHIWLKIIKRGYNTQDIADQLSRHYKISPKLISYAGKKDKHAVTTQWFSLHVPGKSMPVETGLLMDGVEIVEVKRHLRKLQRGALKANQFDIVLAEFAGDRDLTEQRLEEIAVGGFPNYFGEQRFGNRAGNLHQAYQYFVTDNKNPQQLRRNKRALWISVMRSWIFNRLLAERVMSGTWNQALDGDHFILQGTNQFFHSDVIDADITQRVESGDIHPSGFLYGKAYEALATVAGAYEQRILEECHYWLPALDALQKDTARRQFRVIPQGLSHQWINNEQLLLSFTLPSGVYATTLLRELTNFSNAVLSQNL